MHRYLALPLWLLSAFAAGFVGSRFLPGPWYEALAKPEWNPPNWIFAPVWSSLYILMGVAAWLVWRARGFAGARRELGLFLVHLVFNALWSYLFFGLHRPALAFAEILLLLAMIVVLCVTFARVRPLAGWLLLPYAFWVTFASFLNFTLWRMNHG